MTLITVLIAVFAIVMIYLYVDKDNNLKISKEELQQAKKDYEYNVEMLDSLVDHFGGALEDLVDSIPVANFKAVNKKLAKTGKELVREKNDDGKMISLLTDIEEELEVIEY